ncbi:MAG: hypothetical protein GEV10_00480 [Streptosporangiales bacterium]|nr:hypothetical protein [Streptosporangiales bacterium]
MTASDRTPSRPRPPLPPPAVPPRAESGAERTPAPVAVSRSAAHEPWPTHPLPERHHAHPPAPLLLLAGGGAFLLLVIVAAVLGALVGSDHPTARPSHRGQSTASASSSPTGESHRYGEPEGNALYRTGRMAGVDCGADLRSSRPGPYEAFVRESTGCLNRAWRAQLARQRIAYAEPGLVVAREGNPSSPCRSAASGYTPIAFYCPANRTIYYSLPGAAKLAMPKNREYLVSATAHEYAHHIQQVVGISEVYTSRYSTVYPSDVASYTLLTRRLELQAQCLAGTFVGANAPTMRVSRAAMADSVEHTGDEAVDGIDDDPSLRTHGTFRSNARWFLARGWDRRDVVACNTWRSPARQVA